MSVAPNTFANTEFKSCDPTKPGPVDCVMSQTTGAWNQKRVLAQQSWPAAGSGQPSGQLAAWHVPGPPTSNCSSASPQFGYFDSARQDLCGSAFRVGVDNTCWAGGSITPSMLSPPSSKNAGPWNMDNGRYLFKITEQVPPLVGTSSRAVIVQDKNSGWGIPDPSSCNLDQLLLQGQC